jgi:hypothetical protein
MLEQTEQTGLCAVGDREYHQSSCQCNCLHLRISNSYLLSKSTKPPRMHTPHPVILGPRNLLEGHAANLFVLRRLGVSGKQHCLPVTEQGAPEYAACAGCEDIRPTSAGESWVITRRSCRWMGEIPHPAAH